MICLQNVLDCNCFVGVITVVRHYSPQSKLRDKLRFDSALLYNRITTENKIRLESLVFLSLVLPWWESDCKRRESKRMDGNSCVCLLRVEMAKERMKTNRVVMRLCYEWMKHWCREKERESWAKLNDSTGVWLDWNSNNFEHAPIFSFEYFQLHFIKESNILRTKVKYKI